ncbi:MAG: hypothetical protein OHK0039_47520 [Bacteroidia bacterium]
MSSPTRSPIPGHLCLLLSLWTLSLSAQDYNAYYSRNSFFVEGLGRAGLYSVQAERRKVLATNRQVGVAVGGAPLPRMLVVPVSVLTLYGFGAHHIESGAGLALLFSSELSQGAAIYHRLGYQRAALTFHSGYRFQPSTGGFMLRVGYAPFIGEPWVPQVQGSGRGYHHGWYIGLGFALRHAGVG